MLTKRRVIAAKIEATEGTGETLAAADGGILVIDPKVETDIKMSPRNPVMATLSKLADTVGSQLAKITFKVELKGAGAAYSASILPALGKYLRGCGFSQTVDTALGAEKVTYQPASSGVPSITIGCYEDGVLKRIIGARGNVKFTGKVGEPVYADFDFLGVWDGITDTSMISPAYEGTIPPVLLSAAFNVGAYSAVISGFDIDIANALYLRESVNTASGYFSAIISDRKPNGSFDPEMVAVATHDWYGRWKAGTIGALNIGVVGAAQYNKFKITAPKVLYTKVAEADRTGLAVASTNFQLAMDTGDDEVVLEFS